MNYPTISAVERFVANNRLFKELTRIKRPAFAMSMAKRPTIAHIAKIAGVHPSTVSRALRGETGRIAPDTVSRITRAAKELNFTPNPIATGLRAGRSMTIGVILPPANDYEFAQLMVGAQRRALELDYHVMFANLTAAEELAEVVTTLGRRTDGLVIGTALRDEGGRKSLDQIDVPIVLLMRGGEGYSVVRGDDQLGGYLATRHLLDLGHRRIAHIGGRFDTSTGFDRLQGYLRAHREFGLDTEPELVYEGDFTASTARKNAERLFADGPAPTAVFAANDLSALATIAAARLHGINVSRDLSVVGYNNSEFSALLPTPLTTIHVDLARMGACAIDTLVAELSGEPTENTIFDPSLIVRGSTRFTKA